MQRKRSLEANSLNLANHSLHHIHNQGERMNQEITILRLREPRPADVPNDALIFNAPRLMTGHAGWQGEFQHGRFYVAVDPSAHMAEAHIRNNVSLDGYLCEYITDDDIRKWATEHAREHYLTVEEDDWQLWVGLYFDHNRTTRID